MTDPKPPPRKPLSVQVEDDLHAVGGFFKGLVHFVNRGEKVVRAAREDLPEEPHPRVLDAPKASQCDVCGDTRIVGGVRKITCPACRQRPITKG